MCVVPWEMVHACVNPSLLLVPGALIWLEHRPKYHTSDPCMQILSQWHFRHPTSVCHICYTHEFLCSCCLRCVMFTPFLELCKSDSRNHLLSHSMSAWCVWILILLQQHNQGADKNQLYLTLVFFGESNSLTLLWKQQVILCLHSLL